MTANERWPALRDARADDFREILSLAASMTPAQILQAAQDAGRDGHFKVALLLLRLAELDMQALARVWGAKA